MDLLAQLVFAAGFTIAVLLLVTRRRTPHVDLSHPRRRRARRDRARRAPVRVEEVATMGDLYERFTFRGKTLDRMTIAALLCAEKHLGYELTVVQGSYNVAGVAASAGTHDGGGAVDLVWYDIRRKNRALRRVNFAGWPRKEIPGLWGRHWHGILIGNAAASDGAKAQVQSFRDGRDGLASNGPDRWWRPQQVGRFRYTKRAAVSWVRLNDIARRKHGRPHSPEGARQVETVARALTGFGMNIGGHHKGRMDRPLLDALDRFAKIRKIGDTDVSGPVGPAICWELCIPVAEAD